MTLAKIFKENKILHNLFKRPKKNLRGGGGAEAEWSRASLLRDIINGAHRVLPAPLA